MSTTQNEETATFNAGADLSAASNHYRLVKLDTAAPGQVLLFSVLGARADGILANKPALNQPAEVIVEGQTKCKCGAAIASAGLELTGDATGRAIAAVTGNTVFAMSLESTANADEFVGLKIIGPYVKP